MTRTALIAGASGIVGGNLAKHRLARGWNVVGLARRQSKLEGATSLAVDLLDRSALAAALALTRPTHVFFASWLPQSTESENIRVNTSMRKNLLHVVGKLGTVEHVSLVTGLKHYLGPFESYAAGAAPETPFREDQHRTSAANFNYTQEDELFAAASRLGVGWNVHRPHTMIGYAVGTEAVGGVVISGSHGGLYPGYQAAGSKVRAVIFNDAGVGKDDAGIGCLVYLDRLGIAAATVSHTSCRIGDTADMVERGRISHANSVAIAYGVEAGQRTVEAASALRLAPFVSV